MPDNEYPPNMAGQGWDEQERGDARQAGRVEAGPSIRRKPDIEVAERLITRASEYIKLQRDRLNRAEGQLRILDLVEQLLHRDAHRGAGVVSVDIGWELDAFLEGRKRERNTATTGPDTKPKPTFREDM